jgi:hypothetical protein
MRDESVLKNRIVSEWCSFEYCFSLLAVIQVRRSRVALMQRTENIRKQEEAPELDFFIQLQSMTFLVVLYYNIIIASRHFSVFPVIKYLIHVPTPRNMNHVPCMQSDLISKTVGACSLQPYNCPVFSSCTLTIAPCSLPQVDK